MKKQASSAEPSQRMLRVAESIRHAVADIFLREDIMDDTLDTRLITVPEVRVSPDLKWATIFVRYLKPMPTKDLLEALDKHRKFVRHEVTKRVNLKFSPDIRFREDDRMDAADRIDELLRSENVARDLK